MDKTYKSYSPGITDKDIMYFDLSPRNKSGAMLIINPLTVINLLNTPEEIEGQSNVINLMGMQVGTNVHRTTDK